MLFEEFNQQSFKKGANYHIEYITNEPSDVLKAFKGRVAKHSIIIARLGVAYQNIKENENKEVGSLPYGKWENEFIIEHNGKRYLRVTKSSLPNVKTKSIYLLDGEEISKEDLKALGALGNRKTKDAPLVMNINLDNITKIK